jgi:hypothetical protein
MKKNIFLLNLACLLLFPLFSNAQCLSARNKISNSSEITQVLTAAGIQLDSIANGDTLVTLYDVEIKKFFKMVRHQGKVAMVKQNDELSFYYMGTQRMSNDGVLSRVNIYDECGVQLTERTYNSQGVLILETSYQPTFMNDKYCLLTAVTGGTHDTSYSESYLEIVDENRQLRHGTFKTWRGEKLVEEIEYDMGRKIAHNKFEN